ncbi:MAG: ATPase domain-containing protein [Candidatus Nanohaloarchaea archaeon]|nr:ATPase domain-containing protein [Candidatus Nanohaloarchaea archaeon]
MVKVKRVPSGIPGLDNLLDGGIPKNHAVLVSGGYGCGKTIMCSQYIWEGLQNGERCLFISLEEHVEDIKFDARVLGWEFDQYEENGQLDITYLSPDRPEIGFLDEINELVAESYDRIAIDTVSVMLGEQADTQAHRRKSMYALYNNLKRAGATTLITAEIDEEEGHTSRYGVAEYVSDGVIVLYNTGVSEESFRNIEIRKMRSSSYVPGTHPFSITDAGIEVDSSSGF